jgi:cytochrome o ubiquinol oxidase operon protein cyoD
MIRTKIISYTAGFILSILLTLAAFWIAPQFGTLAAALIIAGAILQLLVQLFFFMHIGQRDYPRSNLLVLIFTGIIIGIVIGGTVWIMSNLAHLHVHTPTSVHSPTNTDVYKNGIVAPQNELH